MSAHPRHERLARRMVKRIIKCLMLLGLLLATISHAAPAATEEPGDITLGVLAFRPKPVIETQWRPLIDYLTQSIPGKRFHLRALTFPEMEDAVSKRQVDIVLTNPAHYVLMSKRNGLTSPLATLVNVENQIPLRAFGGVIAVLSSREDLRQLSDLADKRIATASSKSFGGYLMAAHELHLAGIPLPKGERLIETGMPHDNAVDELLAGTADAAFVRSGLIEELQKEGKLTQGQLRIINRQQAFAFPYAISTRLYPEWPIAVLPHVSEKMTSAIAAALFKLPHEGAIAQRIGIHGFIVPMDYHPVVELLRALRQPPFEAPPAFTIGDIWQKYRVQVVIGGLLVALILLLLLLLASYNRRLHEMKVLAEEGDDRLQQLSKQVPGMIYQFHLRSDGTSHYPYASEGALKLFGVTPQALNDSAENMFRLLHPDDVAAFHQRVRQSAQTMQAWKGEYRVILADGKTYWREANAWPEKQADDSILWHGFVTDITERKELEDRFARDSTLHRQVLAALGEGIVGLDLHGCATFMNQRAMEMFGLDEGEALGSNLHQLTHSRHRDGSIYPASDCQVHMSIQDGQMRQFEDWFWHKDGRGFPVSVIVTPIRENEQLTGVVVSFIDISERQQAAARNQLLVAALEASANSVVITDVDANIEWVNPAFCTLTGYSADEIIGKTPALLKSDMHDDAFYEHMWRTLLTGRSWRGEIVNRRKDGCLIEEELIIAPVKDSKGRIHHFVGIKQDISERKRLEEELRFQASTDMLTKLPNRRGFFERSEAELARIKRGKAGGAALIMFDIDYFKRINDTYGHAIGDQVLQHLTETVSKTLRRSDYCGRIGGEEFAVLLPETTAEQALLFAERLRETVANSPVAIEQAAISYTASFGVTAVKNVDVTIDVALARADTALYRAKESGRNRVEHD
ncbi:MAG: diguanylate cyclase [Burkholderiaceae bacterium]|nr:diguanylate cyclase [Burkholderiaceae bacterium]